MVLLAFMAMSGNARADVAMDMTEFYVGIWMVLTIVFLGVAFVKWSRARRMDGSDRSPLYLVIVVLVCLLVAQAAFIAVYKPWYVKKADEENEKEPFEWYLPGSPLWNDTLTLWDKPIMDMDILYLDGRPVVVYSTWESDWYYLRVLNASDMDKRGEGRTLDRIQSIPASTWEPNIINNITLVEVNGHLECYYSLDRPGGPDDTLARMVSSSDGWNWTAPTDVDGYAAGPTVSDVDVPPELADFGWTDVTSSISYDLGQDGILLLVDYEGGGIDDSWAKDTYFAHSWNGEDWSDLVLLWEVDIEWSIVKFHRVEDGRYLGMEMANDSWGTQFDLTEFSIDDLYNVEGPYTD
jgi:hypothetical protein